MALKGDTATTKDFALTVAITNEGGLVNHPNDPGGITKYGVSLRHARNLGKIRGVRAKDIIDLDLDRDGDIDADDIRKLEPHHAKAVYTEHWNHFRFHEVNHPKIVTKFFDLSLPMGYGGSSRVVQRALRACRFDIVEDGFVGPISRRALNEAIEWNDTATFVSIISEAAGYFRDLDSPDFEEGWLKRAYQWP